MVTVKSTKLATRKEKKLSLCRSGGGYALLRFWVPEAVLDTSSMDCVFAGVM